MKKKLILSRWTVPMLFFVFLQLSCSDENNSPPDETGETPTDTTALPPVETEPRVAPNQEAAFDGQTRVPGTVTTTPYAVTAIASGLNRPWGLDFLPNGNMIVSERAGTIRIVTSSGSVGASIANVPAVRAQGDGGLLDLKVDPDFATTRFVFWTYCAPIGNTSVNRVARGTLSEDESSFENVTVIYEGTSPYTGPNHNGSRMLFDAQGLLYVSFGERFDDAIRVQAQEVSSSLGKIVRINKDGSPAAGNPFSSNPDARAEVWSLGHRNPQGLAFNPVTGELWSCEHGPQAGDEVNIITAGSNYGWPLVSYGVEYSGQPVGSGGTQQAGTQQPVYFYDPAIAPSGMTFYTGNLIPEWQNNLFLAALDGRHIARLVINNETHRVYREERLLVDQNVRLRHITQGPDGALYVISDETNGRIFRIAN